MVDHKEPISRELEELAWRAGERWAAAYAGRLRDERRTVVGSWPGTVSEACGRVISDLTDRLGSLSAPDIRALARQLASELSGRRLERLASRVGERTTVLEVARVSHFFAQDKLTFAVSAGRDHAIDYTLADLEKVLDPRRFVRIHRATIANLAYVQELYPGVDGMLVRLKDDRKTELAVARDRVRDLKEKLGI